MNEEAVRYSQGFPEDFRGEAAALYDEAFGAKLGLAVPDPARRVKLLEDSLDPQYSFGAIVDGRLAGVAGFKAEGGSFTGAMKGSVLFKKLGIVAALRAIPVLAFYERKAVPGELLMDGIAVDSNFRGLGIGGQLLTHIADYGREHGYHHVRLDVIDTNPRAKQLYARKGFVEIRTERFEYLRGILGFGAATEMHLIL